MTTNVPPIATDPSQTAPLEAGIGFRVGRAHRALRAAWQARIADLGLSSAQASTLRAIVERPGSGVRDVARTLGTDPMNAKRIADGLESAGLVCSCADASDRRVRVLAPTEDGRVMADRLGARAAAWAATLHTIVGPTDAAALLRILDRLEQGLAALEDVAPAPEREAARG